MLKNILFCLILVTTSNSLSASQVPVSSIEELSKAYTGKIDWNENKKRVTFLTSGTIVFQNRQDYKSFYWGVPSNVEEILIKKDVKIIGQFHFRNEVLIQGEDAETSVVYGTPTPSLLRNQNLDANGGTVPYSAFYGVGDFQLRIENLSSINPIGFHFTGKDGCIIHLDRIRAIDDRGGHHNHSDGISAASGSTVKNSFFSSGDDIIKVYNDIYVENVIIEMIQNCVPIQFGWGNYGSGAKGVFKNVKITGKLGRSNTGNAVIDARKGYYDKYLEIEGLIIENPNAVLVNFWNEGVNGKPGGGNAKITINNAKIEVQQLYKRWNMNAILKICGDTYTENSSLTSQDCLEGDF